MRNTGPGLGGMAACIDGLPVWEDVKAYIEVYPHGKDLIDTMFVISITPKGGRATEIEVNLRGQLRSVAEPTEDGMQYPDPENTMVRLMYRGVLREVRNALAANFYI